MARIAWREGAAVLEFPFATGEGCDPRNHLASPSRARAASAACLLPTDSGDLGQHSRTRRLITFLFPSPLPSPLGRGRPVRRLIARPGAVFIGLALDESGTAATATPPPGESVCLPCGRRT